ncbi:hypothetical protein AMATHDRAFT_47910 [Amanita thiersii Skay4041]|uniref:NADAR domain-containing protein n=1 Tax=Amanita thiersii Skay4041 TaxID=703135 RepID=A0A2A9NRS6_9AGAR|nr:hypothetical protein AMATHDRAFT_47910 [Amanita thiersii Skay4041]
MAVTGMPSRPQNVLGRMMRRHKKGTSSQQNPTVSNSREPRWRTTSPSPNDVTAPTHTSVNTPKVDFVYAQESDSGPEASRNTITHPLWNPRRCVPTGVTTSAEQRVVPSTPTSVTSSRQLSAEPSFYFTQHAPYSGFINDSQYPIRYGDETYMTATHLIEAMKYMGHQCKYAVRIRECKSVSKVRRLSAKFESAGMVRGDWCDVSLLMIENALYAKFQQHDPLQHLLLNIPNVPLVYHNSRDEYWGAGSDGNGLNLLGRALDTVRASLRAHTRDTICQEGDSPTDSERSTRYTTVLSFAA